MYLLPRRLSCCVLRGEHFERGGEYISFLDFDGSRKDYCTRCWEQMEKPKNGHFWRGTVPFKKEKVLPADEKALAFFRQVTDPKQLFVLTLYLLRKQQLVQRTSTLYEIPETGEVFNVEKVFVPLEEGKLLAQEINQHIDGPISSIH